MVNMHVDHTSTMQVTMQVWISAAEDGNNLLVVTYRYLSAVSKWVESIILEYSFFEDQVEERFGNPDRTILTLPLVSSVSGLGYNCKGKRKSGSIKTMDDLKCENPPKSSKYIIRYKEELTIPDKEIISWFDEEKPRDLLYNDIEEAFQRGDEEFEIHRSRYTYIAKHAYKENETDKS